MKNEMRSKDSWYHSPLLSRFLGIMLKIQILMFIKLSNDRKRKDTKRKDVRVDVTTPPGKVVKYG